MRQPTFAGGEDGVKLSITGNRSMNEISPFVRDSPTGYKIEVEVGGKKWHVYRRYSDFLKLHKHIVQHIEDLPDEDRIPVLPPKIFCGYSGKGVVNRRQVELQKYLHDCLRIVSPKDVKDFSEFLEIDIMLEVQALEKDTVFSTTPATSVPNPHDMTRRLDNGENTSSTQVAGGVGAGAGAGGATPPNGVSADADTPGGPVPQGMGETAVTQFFADHSFADIHDALKQEQVLLAHRSTQEELRALCGEVQRDEEAAEVLQRFVRRRVVGIGGSRKASGGTNKEGGVDDSRKEEEKKKNKKEESSSWITPPPQSDGGGVTAGEEGIVVM